MFYFATLKILKFIFNYLSTVTACYLKILKKVYKIYTLYKNVYV